MQRTVTGLVDPQPAQNQHTPETVVNMNGPCFMDQTFLILIFVADQLFRDDSMFCNKY